MDLHVFSEKAIFGMLFVCVCVCGRAHVCIMYTSLMPEELDGFYLIFGI
jgi:hypothetical protein